MKNLKTAIWMIIIAALMLIICAASFAQNQITLKLNNVPIADAVRQLLGQGYVIESGVTGTVSYINATFPDKESALRTLLKSVPGVTYRKDESGTFIISAKASAENTYTPPPTPEPSAGDTTVELPPAEKRIEKIQITFADAFDISAIFGGDSNTSRMNTTGNNSGGYGGMGGGMGMMGGGMGMMGGGMGMMGGGMGGTSSYGGGYNSYGSNRSYGGGTTGYSSGYGGYRSGGY